MTTYLNGRDVPVRVRLSDGTTRLLARWSMLTLPPDVEVEDVEFVESINTSASVNVNTIPPIGGSWL